MSERHRWRPARFRRGRRRAAANSPCSSRSHKCSDSSISAASELSTAPTLERCLCRDTRSAKQAAWCGGSVAGAAGARISASAIACRLLDRGAATSTRRAAPPRRGTPRCRARSPRARPPPRRGLDATGPMSEPGSATGAASRRRATGTDERRAAQTSPRQAKHRHAVEAGYRACCA
jgi:hypothetical protein